MSARHRSLLSLILQPGLWLMRQMGFARRLVFMGVVLLLPLGGMLAYAISSLHERLHDTQRELAGSAVLEPTVEVALLTQKHRGLVNLALAGNTGLEDKLQAVRQDLKVRLATLDAAVRQSPQLQLQAHWQPLHAALGDLAAGRHPADAPASFALHTQQVRGLIALAGKSAETSGLLLDPEAATFHLMVFSAGHLLPWTETMGQMRGQGAALIRRGQMDLQAWLPLVEKRALLESALPPLRETVAALQRAGESGPAGFDDAAARSQAFADLVRQIVVKGDIRLSPAAYFDTGTAAIEGAATAGRSATQRLSVLLQQRETHLQWLLAGACLVGLLGIAGVVYLSFSFFFATAGAVKALQRSVALLAGGNFGAQEAIVGRDEVAEVGRTLDSMAAKLSEIVADIRSNASMVTNAGLRLAADTRALNERTETQAASLEQTAASVHDLTGALSQMAGAAQAADSLAARVRGMAEDGGHAIGTSVQTMKDIQSSSRRVNDIVSVIEGIAFQTNLLALNAAVEAARAGDQGRGFAVVASEVRTLAQRSSAAAREIKTLITDSVSHVDQGVHQVGSASEAFSGIVQGIREVAEQVRAIAGNAGQQSSSVQQISQAVAQIDTLTQQNAQMVEQAMQSSDLLSHRAGRLAGAVANFTLRQGSADEAQAMVTRAVALYRQRGTAALAEITGDAAAWTDRDMYVFALDPQGTYRAFGGNPARCGTSVLDVPGVDGRQLVADAYERAAQGGGWVDYRYTHPVTGEVAMKTSYVEGVAPDVVLGCGVYKREDAAAAAALASGGPAAATAGALARQALAKAARQQPTAPGTASRSAQRVAA